MSSFDCSRFVLILFLVLFTCCLQGVQEEEWNKQRGGLGPQHAACTSTSTEGITRENERERLIGNGPYQYPFLPFAYTETDKLLHLIFVDRPVDQLLASLFAA
jgi:hypothetical protein